MDSLNSFVRESNAIEGIIRTPLPVEIACHETLLRQETLTVPILNAFQSLIAPNMPLRTEEGMDVYVGEHVAPPGGPDIPCRLQYIVNDANMQEDPWNVHCLFEDLHPYMDGNGRTGRALWMWQMHRQGLNPFQRSFLHTWYYQTLAHSQGRHK